MSMSLGRKLMLATVASGALLVGGCVTETTYHPATGRGFNSEGFSERQVEQNRFLVSFAGNSSTPRDTVERYLLFRAAEVTLQAGGDYFVMANRDTDLQSRTYATPGFGPGWGYGGFGGGYWGPSWRYYGRGFGGYGYRRGFGGFGWSPWYGGGFGAFNDFDVETVQRYEATAEIVVGHGPVPRDNVRAFNAHQVAERIGPTVVLPGQERRR
ncbi:CC0125/CC1285 family lipoprotein [Sphingomonas sp.]|uniref:CC0125/CC1285 family lipoprotein n=1 Tax=Sphingomonas sp. TaxID=28214 RepID=UPI003CC6774B